MMKLYQKLKILSLLLMLLLFNVSVKGQVYITEIADPNNNSGARYVELYNAGAASFDLAANNYALLRYTNGNSGPQTAVGLTGTIAAGGFYVISNNGTTYNTVYSLTADQDIGTGGPADSNGDDQILLIDNTDNLNPITIDIFGVIGEDGTGTGHEFEDGRAERKMWVSSGNTTWDVSEWNIDNDSGGGSGTQDAPADFDPAAWIGPDITNPSFVASTADNPGEAGFDLNVEVDEEATVYYVVLSDGATAPNVAEIEAGTGNGGGAADASGSIAVDGNTPTTETLMSLASSTAYDVYVFAKDFADNSSAVQTKIDITTTADQAPTMTGALTSTANFSNSIELSFSEAVNSTDESGFSITIGGVSTTITGISGSGTTALTLTISEDIWKNSGTILISYDDTAGDVADVTPNVLVSFSDASVTNNTTTNIAANITEARAFSDGESVSISGEVIVTYVTGNSRDQIFIQDSGAGILIDDNAPVISTSYSEGDGITDFQGTIASFGGITQIVPDVDPGTVSSTGNSIIPITVTIADFNAALDTYESRILLIENVNFTNADGTLTFTDPTSDYSDAFDGVNTTTFDADGFLNIDYSANIIPYGQLDLIVIGRENNGTPIITSRSGTDIQDNYAPLFVVAPATTNVTSSSFDVTFQADEPGIVYYVVDENAVAPAVATILAGGNMAFTNVGTDVTINIGSLTGATQYYVHIIAADDEGTPNEQTVATTVTATTSNNDGDSDITAVASGETSNIDYTLFQDAATLTTTNSASLFTFSLNDKATTDAVSTTLTAISFDITNHENLRTVALFEGTGTTSIAELDVAGNIATSTLSFTGLSLEATTGASLNIHVRATFLAVVDDNEQIQLTITNATVDGAGSSFDTSDAGGAASDISTTDLNAIAVTATLFDIDAPTSTTPSTDFTISATAMDANGNTDIDTRSVTLSLKTGAGTLSSVSGLGPNAMTAGVYAWSDVQYDTEEIITVDVTDGSITITSGDINIFTATGGVFISEYIEGSSNNKAIEVFNNTGGPINLADYKLGVYSNGSADIGNNITLSDIAATLAHGEVLVISNASAADANIIAASDITSSVTFFNGNDAVALLENDVVIDVIGEIGNDPGTAWDVAGVTNATLNHTLVRKSSITEGNAVNLASFGTNVTDSEWEVLAQDVTTNIGSHTIDVAGGPLVTIDAGSFIGSFGAVTENTISSSRTFTVEGSDLTADIIITPPSGFTVSLDDVTFAGTVTLTQSSGSVTSTTVHVRFEPTAVQAYSGDITLASNGANDKTIAVSGTGLSSSAIFFEGFDTCPSASMVTFSAASDANWDCTSSGNTGNAAFISGFGADAASDDWLITPAVDLSAATNATLTFYSWNQFTDAVHPPIKAMASSDYSGTGDPTGATWTELPALFAAENSQTWTVSGDVNLQSYVGGSVYIAFQYTSTGTGSNATANWSIDDILVEDRTGVANPSFTITASLNDFGSVDNGSTSTSQSFTVEGDDLVDDVTVTAPTNFEVSLDNSAFSTSVNLTPTGGTLTSTTVHARFAPTSGINGPLSGDITLATTNANNQTIALTGTETGNEEIMNDLFFSEYLEGSSNNRAFEIFNGTGASVDLSNYSVKQSHNGVGFGNDPDADAYDLPLSGTLADGDVYVIYNADATDATIIAEGDLPLTYGDTGGARLAAFTGDDALGLFKNGILIDLIGDPDNDPGTGWSVAGITDGTVNHTLVRKETITTGNITPLGSFGTDTNNSEWVVLDLDDVSSIGSHTGSDPIDPGFTLTTTDFNGDFGSVAAGEASTASSYTVSGTEITGDFTITIPVGFEASLTSDFSNKVGNSSLPLSITPANGDIDNVTVYVRFIPGEAASFGGDLVNSATGYPDVTLALTGTGTEEVLGIEDILAYNIAVYPNPVSKILSINIPNSFGAGYVKLVNMEGAIIKTGSIGAINGFDVSDLRSGIYLLQITNQQTVISHRVIIK